MRSAQLKLVLGTFAAVTLLGCGQQVAGQPTDAAGFSPPQASSQATMLQGPTTASPAPRRIDGVDLCTLLIPADLQPLGGTTGPATRNSVLPESCSYILAGGAPADLALVAWYKPIEQVRGQQPDGRAEQANGYPAWIACKTDDGYNSCTAAIAVRPDRTVLTGLTQRDTPTATVIQRLQTLTTTVINRLPTA